MKGFRNLIAVAAAFMLSAAAFAEENDNIKVCKLNVDEATELAITFGVMSIPTVLLFENGQEVKRFVGAKEKHQIAEFVAE